MNNDLAQFSEERLIEIADFAMAGAIEVVELARIALAAKQAKPVACKFGKNNGDGTYTPTYDYWPLPSYIVPHKDWPVTLFYDAPQPAIIEQAKPVPVGWEVCSPEWCNKHNSCHEAPRIWFESEDGTGQHYHPSVYTTPQPAHTEQANPVAWLLSGGGTKNIVSFDSGNAYADPSREVTPLYTTQQTRHAGLVSWIECSEQMPETYLNVLLTDEADDMCIGQLESHDDTDFFVVGCPRYKATHWMPLPAAPKPESEL